MSFLFRRKSKAGPDAPGAGAGAKPDAGGGAGAAPAAAPASVTSKPPTNGALPPTGKRAGAPAPEPERVRADEVLPDAGQDAESARRRNSRRASQSLIGKPLSYNGAALRLARSQDRGLTPARAPQRS